MAGPYTPTYGLQIKDPAVVKEFNNVQASLAQMPLRALLQRTPSDPTGTASTTGVMMGLGVTANGTGQITLVKTGAMFVMISGNLTNTTAVIGNGAQAQLRYGVGQTPPANGAALTGIAIGSAVSSVLEEAVSDLQPFSCQAIVMGLQLGTYWIDLALAAVIGGTGVARNLSLSAFEL